MERKCHNILYPLSLKDVTTSQMDKEEKSEYYAIEKYLTYLCKFIKKRTFVLQRINSAERPDTATDLLGLSQAEATELRQQLSALPEHNSFGREL